MELETNQFAHSIFDPKDRKIRVLYLLTGLGLGGAERQAVDVAKGIAGKGYKVSLVSMIEPGQLGKSAVEQGLQVESLNMRRGIPSPFALLKMRAILRRWRPHIVHSHMVHANLFARVSRALLGFPVQISTIHSIWDGGRLFELGYRITDGLCDLTTQVSKAGLERYRALKAAAPQKIMHVPNGVDASHFRPLPEERKRLRSELNLGNEFVWVAVGRFEESKDHANMLRAFYEVSAKHKNTKLLLVGQGAELPQSRELALALGLRDKVSFLGARNDIVSLLNASDGYVMSSAWEGMPMVLLEAGAVGLPIVSTNVGGVSDIVIDGKSGYLAPPLESRALAQRMLELMDLSLEARISMGSVGRQHICNNFCLESVIDQWDSIYRRHLYRRRRLGTAYEI